MRQKSTIFVANIATLFKRNRRITPNILITPKVLLSLLTEIVFVVLKTQMLSFHPQQSKNKKTNCFAVSAKRVKFATI